MITHVIRMKYVELPIIPTEFNGFLEVLAGDLSATVLESVPVQPMDQVLNGLDYATLKFVPNGNEPILLYPGDLILIHKDRNEFSAVISPTEYVTEKLRLLVGGD